MFGIKQILDKYQEMMRPEALHLVKKNGVYNTPRLIDISRTNQPLPSFGNTKLQFFLFFSKKTKKNLEMIIVSARTTLVYPLTSDVYKWRACGTYAIEGYFIAVC
jgi:hypothetical protein